MSRFKRFGHSLVSGYAVIAAQAVFTLASVPLALAYLPKAEFGLWALAAQIAGYIALVDLGMSGAVSRILIEYKDRPEDEEYGSTIATGFLVNLVQGAIVLVAAYALTWVLVPLLDVPAPLAAEFRVLILWQCIGIAISFALRIVLHILTAHQRQDVVNYSHMAYVLVNLAVLWICFRAGQGVVAMVWAQVAAQLTASLIMAVYCMRLRLLPDLRAWSRPTAARFYELFAFGRDMFLYSIGAQLVQASQTILITRTLGLEAGAIWAIGTRSFAFVNQLATRVFDYSLAPLAEMIVRNEKELLAKRFRMIVVASSSAAVAGGMILVACNSSFVGLWTSGKVSWPSLRDFLFSIWLVLCVLVRCHTGLIGLTRDFRFLRYIYLLEGIFFVVAAIFALKWAGIEAMIATSILATLSFTLGYSVHRASRYFEVSPREIAIQWMLPTLRLVGVLLPATCAIYLLTLPLSIGWRFVVSGLSVTAVAAWLLWQVGLGSATRLELQQRVFSRWSNARKPSFENPPL